MAQTINTNVASLNAQRNLNASQGSLATSLQRLSSGLRINSAKDDAAGLAISERFSTQIRGLNQAVRNANDGISLAQTAEGALGEVTNNLQRIRELAVQSANATNSASDRQALQAEVKQRLAEVERVASQTNFNGLRVLDGSFGTAQFQVGANAGQTISVNLSQGVKTTQIGQVAEQTSDAVTTAAISGTGTIKVGNANAVTIGASVAGPDGTTGGQGTGSAYAKAAAINAAAVPGLTVTAQTNIEFTLGAVNSSGAADSYSLSVNGEKIFDGTDVSAAAGGSITAQTVADKINAASSKTGVTATLTGGDLRLSAADGRDIIIGQTLGADATGGIVAGAGGATEVNGVTFADGKLGTFAEAQSASPAAATINGGTLTFSASENIEVTGDGVALGLSAANVAILRDTQTIDKLDISTVAGANEALQRLDSALQSVGGIRANLGATQNRFESTIANLQTNSENLAASRGRILDADFATETANLTRAQILQQAGTAMLAQANGLPQNVLSLLRG